jgi:hypothetical protein
MSDGPWDVIGWWVIGSAIRTAIRRHWRLIIAAINVFLLWGHFIARVG